MKNTKAHIAVLLTNLFFAGNYSLVKTISPDPIKPYALNVLRVAGSLLLFWMLWAFAKNKSGIQRKDLFRFILCGLFGVAINQMLFIKGLTMTSAIHASLLSLVTPILITILAFWILREAVTIRKMAGLALGIGGSVFLIIGKQDAALGGDYLIGDLLIILNAISYALYFILVKPLMEKYTPLQVVRWVFTFGFVMMLPVGWGQLGEIEWNSIGTSQFASLAFVVIAGTFLAYVFNAFGIQVLGTGVTGSYIYAQPVFAVLLAVLFFNEELTMQKVIAGLGIIGGVFLVSKKIN
jgi:drug/metabolite transporter (DMT)-like permease